MSGKAFCFVIIFLIILIPIENVFGDVGYSIYNKYGFYLEYPSDWEVVDNWNNYNEVYFKADYMGKTRIAISYQKNLFENSIINQDLVNKLSENLMQDCRINKHGSCWNFELLDAKIVTIGISKALSIKYYEVLNDQKTTIRTIFLPMGQNMWSIEWQAVGDGIEFEEQLEKTVYSFQLEEQTTQSSPTLTESVKISSDPNITVQRNYDVNLILVGQSWPQLVISYIRNNLPEHIDPVAESEEKTGIRHTYNYKFFSLDDSEVDDVVKFMKEHSSQVPIFGSNIIDIPIWQAYWVYKNHPEWTEIDSNGNIEYQIDYRLVDAKAMEEFLYESYVSSNPELSSPNSVNLFFIDLDLNEADFLRNYYIKSEDDASRQSFTSVGLMGFGGNYNLMFFDLYAAPWIDYDLNSQDYYFPKWLDTLHDCSSYQCLSDLVSFHTEESLRHVVSPSLLYKVSDADKYIIDTIIYTKPGGQNTVTPQTLNDFVDKEKVKKEFEFLYPFSEWEVNFFLERRDTRGLSYDFKKVLESTQDLTFDDIFGNEKTIQILSSSKIKPYLLSWAEELKTSSDDKTIHIPVLIEIASSNNFDVYIDGYGILGIAPSMDNSDEPCCAFGITSQKKLWKQKIGFTDLLIHEVGHTMGLMHSFQSINDVGDAKINQYFNWYASPMTYSIPNTGCGFLFSLVYSDPCGNASLSFTEFERNIITDARLASLWQKTDSNLKHLHSNNDEIKKLVHDSKSSYQKGDVYSLKGSLVLARKAFHSSTSGEVMSDKTITPKIPDWIKNNAKWWAAGQIDEESFVQGIQFLVKEKIISIPPPTQTGIVADNHVPDWIKNNAKWWSEGLIGEGDFLKGIEFLAKSGIISVN